MNLITSLATLCFIFSTLVFSIQMVNAGRLISDYSARQRQRPVSSAAERSDGLSTDVIEKLQEVRDRGIEWLMSQKSEDFGWPSGDTARVVVALASSIKDWPSKNDLVSRLIVKQLEIELLEKLLRKDIDPVTPAKLAFYALAVGAACRDPHNFYGHNLIATLEKHHDDQDFPGYPETFGFSLTSLVTCLAGSHLHKRRTRHLMQIARDDLTKLYSIDTRAMAFMALECVHHRKKSGEVLAKHMHEPLDTMCKEQKEDGSFGNIHSTALTIQAIAASKDHHKTWNKTAAASSLIAQQDPNGSFLNNLHATAETVVAASALLNGSGLPGLLLVRRGHCHSIRRRYQVSISSSSNFITDEELHQDNYGEKLRTLFHLYPFATFTSTSTSQPRPTEVDNATTTETLTSTSTSAPAAVFGPSNRPELVSVRYWLWIGPDPPTAERFNLTVRVPANITFFFVMQRAAELATEFEFSSTMWPNGHYIHTISGHHEEPVGYHYWLLYILKSDPDPVHPPSTTFVAPAGVDDLRVKDGQVYLFWYKKI